MFENTVFVVEQKTQEPSLMLGAQLTLPEQYDGEQAIGIYSAQNGRFVFFVPKKEPVVDEESKEISFTDNHYGFTTLRELTEEDEQWILAPGWVFSGTFDEFRKWCEWQSNLSSRKPSVVAEYTDS